MEKITGVTYKLNSHGDYSYIALDMDCFISLLAKILKNNYKRRILYLYLNCYN